MLIWPRWGWIQPSPRATVPASVNLRRERLDPLVREMAAQTPGVDLMLGESVDRLLSEDGHVGGAEAVNRSGRRSELRAPLVIGADGRDSRVAKLAQARAKTWPHGRFAYGGYFEGPSPAGAPNASLWFLDPQWAAAFPTDAGLTFYACMLTSDRLQAFRRDPELGLRSFVAELPEAPPIKDSRLVSPVIGKIDMTNVRHAPIAPGLALIGDAALATDPLWGVGCGWAFQSGEWLADSVAPALRGERSLASGLRRYQRRFRRALGAHAAMIHDYADGRRLNPAERILFSAAARDRRLGDLFEAFGTRNLSPGRFMASGVPRALAVHAAQLFSRSAGGATRAEAAT
jgi:2-polyprenyl-6-methoxyphenol hydroxylase-like FAD-dependent oxidoreductase